MPNVCQKTDSPRQEPGGIQEVQEKEIAQFKIGKHIDKIKWQKKT